ncbi:MAG: integrase [Gammaproteobacteria bacterium]|nr:MAG: integrase [Gammaproteobacteria bacterium]
MNIKKVGEKYLVDMYPNGRVGKRVRKKFDTRIEAARFEKFVLASVSQKKEWNPSKSDNRRISELIEVWFKLCGVHLKDGIRRKSKLQRLCLALGDPIAKKIESKNFVAYRSMRIANGIAPKTMNNELSYIDSMFSSLNKIGEIDYSNPIDSVDMLKLDERELSWLTSEQINALLAKMDDFSLNPHVKLLTKISLATGARWGEAEALTLSRVTAGKLTFSKTKSGKNRSIPVSAELFNEIRSHLRVHGRFTHSLSAFRRALKAANIELPAGQSAHVLRHTFASHFMMNGGDILTLQKILGHSSIVITMRYAHLSRDHLSEAVSKNPLQSAGI